MFVIRAGIHKMLVRIVNRKDLTEKRGRHINIGEDSIRMCPDTSCMQDISHELVGRLKLYI